MQFIKIDQKSQIDQRLSTLKNILLEWDFTHSCKITFDKYTDARSLNQNALAHIWFKDISDSFKRRRLKWYYLDDDGNEIGEPNDYSPLDIKLAMKHKYLGYENIQFGKIIAEKQLKSTSDLDKGEMMHFLNQVYAFGLNNGVRLVVPQDSEYKKLKDKHDGKI